MPNAQWFPTNPLSLFSYVSPSLSTFSAHSFTPSFFLYPFPCSFLNRSLLLLSPSFTSFFRSVVPPSTPSFNSLISPVLLPIPLPSYLDLPLSLTPHFSSNSRPFRLYLSLFQHYHLHPPNYSSVHSSPAQNSSP